MYIVLLLFLCGRSVYGSVDIRPANSPVGASLRGNTEILLVIVIRSRVLQCAAESYAKNARWKTATHQGGEDAPFIHPCDPTDLACLKQSAQYAVPYLALGVPELGLSPLDPVTIPHMETNEAGLQLTFTDTVIKGLRNCTVMSLRRLDNQTAIDLKCSVTLVGRYKLSGMLLFMPIRGEGKYKITIRNIIVKTLLDIEQQVRGGQRYWHVTGWSHTSDMPTFVRFRFNNLFDGDERLSKQIHAIANKSWYDIFQEVSPPVTRAIVARIVEETTKLFDAVPLDQLAKE